MNVTSMLNRLTATSGGASDDVLAEAASIGMQRVDEAAAVVRPAEVDEFYIEAEFDHRAAAQPRLFEAEGESHARAHAAAAEGLRERAADQSFVVELQKPVVADSSTADAVAPGAHALPAPSTEGQGHVPGADGAHPAR